MNREFEFDAAVVVGRWQLPHIGHDTLFQRALTTAPRVIIVIGSAFRSRDTRQPFTADERKDMILASLPQSEHKRVSFLPVRDYFDDDRWDREVAAGVASLTKHGERIALVGYKKDFTSYYLERFPSWRSVQVEPVHDIDATSLRGVYFGSEDLPSALAVMSRLVAPGVLAYLQAWAHLPQYRRLVQEYATLVDYRKRWPAPWHLTADSVVRLNDHILLVRRGGDIGHGQWALPGGFVEPNEMFLPAALRELQEETGFPFSRAKMRSALKSSAVFAHPLRSPRGRIVTHAFYFAFGPGPLPEVRAGDDAMEVRWVLISELPAYEDQLFEDHAAILDHFVGLFPKT